MRVASLVIAGLQSARDWLRGMATLGYSEPADPKDVAASKAFYGDPVESRRKWSARLAELERSCKELISRGGADYDGQDVN